MSQTVLTVLPIFLLIGVGFLGVRVGLLSPAHTQGLSAFVLNFALPAVIVAGFSSQDLAGHFNAGFLFAYAAGSLVAFASVFLALRLAGKSPLGRAALAGLGASASNSGFIGYPVAALVLGPTAMVALPLVMLVENLLIIPLALALGELANSAGAGAWRVLRQTFARLMRMPILVAILAGALLAATGIQLPTPALSTLDLLAAASAPCALVAVGAMVAGLETGDLSGEVFTIAAGKLLVHPLAVGVFLFMQPGMPAEMLAAGLLFSCVSMVTIYPLLGARFGQERMAAAALIVTTVLGFFTLIAVTASLPVPA